MQIESESRPSPEEYAPYYEVYVSAVGDGNIMTILADQIVKTIGVLAAVSEREASFRYSADKWSIRQLAGHLIDTERIMSFRALAFARGDKYDIAGMDQDQYVAEAEFDNCRLSELASEFESLRRANIAFFRNLPNAAWSRGGKASDNFVTVKGLAFIIAGHELHHMKILKERYLSAPGFGN